MMKMNTRSLVIRAPSTLGLAPRLQPLLVQRYYATQTGLGTTATSKSKRRTVTPFNDTGAVPWAELSAGEKAARATQQTFNFGLILAGFKTAHFNRVVDRIKSDAKCIDLLGDPKKISAHGDETYNKWRRARPIASTISTDSRGHEHLVMHFYVEGPLNRGTVYLHMIRTPSSGEFEYKYLYLDVKGHHRIYLENADTGIGSGKKGFRFLGISW
ncbi:Mitochondrial import inner membrane translocase subunit TIM21 [Colletotrichum fructicola Nara gc5]|uniref:Mitochondrial import inner membrane translocase subunit Tim21 n=1 Tax=Colletotrichum fructicola (strain Nara gc5) TaxID=1213859 RepID=A0A7J6JAJ3_COLFN|nr:Mitochondrial import inner membrane translocase subunit TIM21 [Colletotrichum fructicola Nara gc5]KAF5495460.1 Mitochondrial import inner membrane translocase subunit TIM21 [Colletotrichum fructicola]